MRNSNTIIGIASLLLATLAEAHTGSGVLQQQAVKCPCFKDVRASAQSTLKRVPPQGAALLRVKNRQSAQSAIADTSLNSFEHALRFAGPVSGGVDSRECSYCGHSASSRAPPLS